MWLMRQGAVRDKKQIPYCPFFVFPALGGERGVFKDISIIIKMKGYRGAGIRGKGMAFFTSAINILQTLVVAIGAGLAVWGVINLLEGYGNDNPGANAHVR